MSLIGTMFEFAGQPVNETHHYLEAVMPTDGTSWFCALVPPKPPDGPEFCIKKKTEDKPLTRNEAEVVRARIRARDNFVIHNS